MSVTKKLIIDVDLIIEDYNKKNPTLKPMTRKSLAKLLGVNPQVFSDWKNGRTPELVVRLFKLMEIGECDVRKFIIEKTIEDEKNSN